MGRWDYLVSEEDRSVMEKSGYGARRGLGQRLALLVVDVQYKFVGLDKPILESMESYPISLGERAWRAMENIEKLLAAARAVNLPVFYSTSGGAALDTRFDSFARKKFFLTRSSATQPWPGDEIPQMVAPHRGEVVFNKMYPSCFFGTPLMTYLNTLQVDTLLICGFVTGGCVRATVVEAASYNFNVALLQDAVADRIQASHDICLLDMDMKYADVMDTRECIEKIG